MQVLKKSRRALAYELWRQQLESSPPVKADDSAESIDPEGKTGILGKREPVGFATKGYSAEAVAEAGAQSDRGVAAKQHVRVQERTQVESESDAQNTAERLLRGHAVQSKPPEVSLSSLANLRRESVRRSRQKVTARDKSAGAFDRLPHPQLWNASTIGAPNDDAPTPIRRAEVHTGPQHGSAVIH